MVRTIEKISIGDDIHNKKTEAGASQEKKKFNSGSFSVSSVSDNRNLYIYFPFGTDGYETAGRIYNTGI